MKQLIQDFIENNDKHIILFDIIVQSLSLQMNYFSQLEFKHKSEILKAVFDIFDIIKLK